MLWHDLLFSTSFVWKLTRRVYRRSPKVLHGTQGTAGSVWGGNERLCALHWSALNLSFPPSRNLFLVTAKLISSLLSSLRTSDTCPVTVWQCSSNVGCLFVGECKTGQRCPENKTLKAVGQFLSNPEPGGGGGNKNNGGLSSSYPFDDQDWWESKVSAVLCSFEFESYRGYSIPRGGTAISQLSQSCLTSP